MKRFLAVYIGTEAARADSGWDRMSEEERREKQRTGMEAWSKWVEAYRDAIVDVGTPLGKTRRASAQGIEDVKNDLVAYTIVEADSHEAAAKLFEQHPHFTLFPGDSVEIMECLPMPAM